MTTEEEKNIIAVVRSYKSKEDCKGATDEDVKQFIELFIEKTNRFNLDITSYGLKHVAENVIGHLFYGVESWAYVSNDQIKRCMGELGFAHKPASNISQNDVYKFQFKKEVVGIMRAFTHAF